MVENIQKNYFLVIRFLIALLFVLHYIMTCDDSLFFTGCAFFLLAGLMASIMFQELAKKKKIIYLIPEILFLAGIFLILPEYGIFLLPMVILDLVTGLKGRSVLYMAAYAGVFWCPKNWLEYLFLVTFFVVLYYQNYVILGRYKAYLEESEKEEYKLKNSMDNKDFQFQKQLASNSLAYENRMLEERARLSQALHDKLGHNINGSLYQLEACKLLVTKEPEESVRIMQAVIDTLRQSMDEIRLILRKERPDRQQATLLQISSLCQECQDKYGITTTLEVEGDKEKVPEKIWGIIRDNTFEAVTNALRYAKCSEIHIKICILHKLVRCVIRDNGVGCENCREGMGIQGMHLRAEEVNGTVSIRSESGFEINMILPFADRTEE